MKEIKINHMSVIQSTAVKWTGHPVNFTLKPKNKPLYVNLYIILHAYIFTVKKEAFII